MGIIKKGTDVYGTAAYFTTYAFATNDEYS